MTLASHKLPSDSEKRLTLRQQQAAMLLASGSTIAATASAVGVSEKSVDNWKKLPAFLAAVHATEDTLYDENLRLLKKTAKAAIACLVRNMEGKISAYVQVQAASKLLDLSIQLHKIEDLEAEVEELRQLVGQDDNLT